MAENLVILSVAERPARASAAPYLVVRGTEGALGV